MEISKKDIPKHNISYFFQVECLYNSDDKKEQGDKSKNNELIDKIKKEQKKIVAFGQKKIKELPDTVTKLSFKTQYPGLLIGIGYPHEYEEGDNEQDNGQDDEQIKMGFFFDYVSGAPYYPGSSLKGIIRDVFDHAKDNDLWLEYIKDIAGDLKIDDKDRIDKAKIEQFIKIVFGTGEKDGNGNIGNDIFYGGFIVAGPGNKPIMGIDNIAPHGEADKINVIKMLRIMPEVTITFAIDVRDIKGSETEPLFTCDFRKQLYLKILKDFGIGAKRNVGYGNLIPIWENLEGKGRECN